MEWLKILFEVSEYMGLAWFVSRLEPLQLLIEDLFSEDFEMIYTLLSCI